MAQAYHLKVFTVLLWRSGQGFEDGVDVVDAAAPGAPADVLEGGPEAGVVGQVGVGRQVGVAGAAGEDAGTGTGAEAFRFVAHQVDAAFEGVPVDDDFDDVAIGEFADRAAGEGLRTDVADAGTGGEAGEAGVGEDGDPFPKVEVFERGGDLGDFLHARAQGPPADEDHDVARFDASGAGVFQGGDGGTFGCEGFGRAGCAVDAVCVDDGGVDGRAFDDGAFGGDVAGGEADGAGKPPLPRPVGAHDDVFRGNAVQVPEALPEAGAAF